MRTTDIWLFKPVQSVSLSTYNIWTCEIGKDSHSDNYCYSKKSKGDLDKVVSTVKIPKKYNLKSRNVVGRVWMNIDWGEKSGILKLMVVLGSELRMYDSRIFSGLEVTTHNSRDRPSRPQLSVWPRYVTDIYHWWCSAQAYLQLVNLCRGIWELRISRVLCLI